MFEKSRWVVELSRRARMDGWMDGWLDGWIANPVDDVVNVSPESKKIEDCKRPTYSNSNGPR